MTWDGNCDQLETVSLLGVRIHPLCLDELFEILDQTICTGQKALIANVNVHAMNLAERTPWFKRFLNQADIVFCDGAGIMLGTRLLGQQIPQRITYADWMWQLAEFAEPRGWSFFFLGAHPGVADQAASRLKARFPALKIVGSHHGYFDKAADSIENLAVIREINGLRPNILVLGFGMPLQERWLLENWDRIEATIALPGGAVFDYVSGNLRRAPNWMTNRGLEWLGRLLIEPRRLWRRYLIGNPLFLWRVLKQRLGLYPTRRTSRTSPKPPGC